MKKFTAILLAILLVFALSTVALANENTCCYIDDCNGCVPVTTRFCPGHTAPSLPMVWCNSCNNFHTHDRNDASTWHNCSGNNSNSSNGGNLIGPGNNNLAMADYQGKINENQSKFNAANAANSGGTTFCEGCVTNTTYSCPGCDCPTYTHECVYVCLLDCEVCGPLCDGVCECDGEHCGCVCVCEEPGDIVITPPAGDDFVPFVPFIPTSVVADDEDEIIEILDIEVPLADAPVVEEIEEEVIDLLDLDVPLSDMPATGVTTIMWGLGFMVSALGTTGVVIKRRKI
jgi:hypothetical protein